MLPNHEKYNLKNKVSFWHGAQYNLYHEKFNYDAHEYHHILHNNELINRFKIFMRLNYI